MNPRERQSAIIAALAANDEVEVTELSESLGVSRATIRRDLALLEFNAILRRTHGGAVRTKLAYELPLRYRESRQEDEKSAIANAAATYIAEDMRVGLSGGTTLAKVGQALGPGPPIKVVTNSLSVASELARWPQHTLVATGGFVRSRSYEMVGPLADKAIAEFNLDICIIGADGVSALGASTHDQAEAATNRVLVESADRCIVAVDQTKLGKTMFSRICSLGDIHILLTNDYPPDDFCEALESHNVELVVAESTSRKTNAESTSRETNGEQPS